MNDMTVKTKDRFDDDIKRLKRISKMMCESLVASKQINCVNRTEDCVEKLCAGA